jgi:hypothetical protein
MRRTPRLGVCWSAFHQPGIRPGTDDLYIVTNDAAGGQGATIFHARRSRAAALLAAVNHSRTGAACDSADFAPSDRTAVAASTLSFDRQPREPCTTIRRTEKSMECPGDLSISRRALVAGAAAAAAATASEGRVLSLPLSPARPSTREHLRCREYLSA